MKRRNYVITIILLGVIVLAIGCIVWLYHRPAAIYVPPKEPGNSQAPAPVGSLDHVVIIVEENKPASQIIGNSSAPYINKLADEGSLATHYSAITHPSLPNYIALTSGTTAGITNDCNPPEPDCQADVANIADEIERVGKSWKMYAESMPAPCTAANAGDYAVRHNPFLYYPDIRNDNRRCRQHVVPFSQFAADLKSDDTFPNYVFVSPNLCNDMHNCSIKTGDDWLAQQVPKMLQAPAFADHQSLLVITWDEGSSSDNIVPTIFAGPAAKKQFQSQAYYSHYSLLRTVEKSWGLTPLTANDKGAPVMGDMLR